MGNSTPSALVKGRRASVTSWISARRAWSSAWPTGPANGEPATWHRRKSSVDGKCTVPASERMATSLNPAPIMSERNSSASPRPNGARMIVAACPPTWCSSASARMAKPGLCWIGRQTRRTARPLGASTRCISRRAADRSGKYCSPSWQMTTSKLPSAKAELLHCLRANRLTARLSERSQACRG
jgi:hypothetical protein